MLTAIFLLAVLLIVFGRSAIAALIVTAIFAAGIFVLASVAGLLWLVVSATV